MFQRVSPLFPEAVAVPNTLYTGFTNANAMLHVANCVANAGRIENGPSYKFYAEGVTPAVARASAGAVEHVSVAVVKNLARYLGEIKGPHLWIWAAAGDAETSMWRADLSGGAVFVLGAEGKGLRPLVRRTCDDAVSIPHHGRVESLNVSVAAALLLYEARRQRG